MSNINNKTVKWQTVPLGTIADFRNGINYTKDNFGKGIKVINVRDFQDHSIAAFDSLDEVEPTGIIKREDLLKKNDLIFVRSNGNRELIGRSLFIADIKEQVTHSAFTIKLRFKSNKVFPRFYAYVLRSSLMRQTLSAQGNGTNISNLNQRILSDLLVPFPPLPTQKKIAAILSGYDDLIENNTRRIKILEEMAQTLYHEWFVKFRFPGHEHTKMVDSELGLIPAGWEVRQLSEVCQRITDGSHWSPKSVDQGYPMASVKDMSTWGLNVESCRKISEHDYEKLVRNDCKPLKNDILIAKDGNTYLKHMFVVQKEIDLVILSSIAIVRPNLDNILPYVLVLHLLYPPVKSRLKNYVSGAAIPRIILKDFAKFTIVVPSINIQHKFFNIAEAMIKDCHCLIAKNSNLRQTRDLLLPKLISGEIDVEHLEITAEDIAA
ncbi:MAG: restriction endonuclease subunit S [Gloeotrichia echinulata IR180]